MQLRSFIACEYWDSSEKSYKNLLTWSRRAVRQQVSKGLFHIWPIFNCWAKTKNNGYFGSFEHA